MPKKVARKESRAKRARAETPADVIRECSPDSQRQLLEIAKLLQKHSQEKQTAATDVNTLRNELQAEVDRRTEVERDLQEAHEQAADDQKLIENLGKRVDDCDRSIVQMRARLNRVQGMERALETARAQFVDTVTLEEMKCPIPLSDGEVQDMETVIQHFINSPPNPNLKFNGKLEECQFVNPRTREIVHIMCPLVIRFVQTAFANLGMRAEMPFYFEYSEAPVADPSDIVWRPYEVEFQLAILLQILLMHRERNDQENATRMLTTKPNHLFTIKRTKESIVAFQANDHHDHDITTDRHRITYALCIIDIAGVGHAHHVRFKTPQVLNLQDFILGDVADGLLSPQF